MGFIVNENCGIKIPMYSPQRSIDGYVSAMRRLHANPAELSRLSQGALDRSKQLSWDYAAEQIALGYDRVLSEIEKNKS
jgi:glycosyltransferase involved in cell wall biosynthesis